ncbi:hypothetical protein MNEG_11323 [Monoraphidium neglectum]|uniref:Uncharacterized protein n=1 Tax=Monoraphidium neglectum TaxID=145388 RepID=A0A0D2KLN7_9CHLO|nr:hypothetical protein MNEG_11323 [Monoraphidium neglectum]KIY96638.1 hypothetical protein MNEG_11323 [Monoraphidium neglectum]|eukprot:XP_013895658.1 hypothetical protein MNEG_11323 [Monoraphidium neglectum]
MQVDGAGDGEQEQHAPGPSPPRSKLGGALARLLRRSDAPDGAAPDGGDDSTPDAALDDEESQTGASRAHGLARQRLGPHEDSARTTPVSKTSSRLLGRRPGGIPGPGSVSSVASGDHASLDGTSRTFRPHRRSAAIAEDTMGTAAAALPEHAAKMFVNMNQDALVEEDSAARQRRGVIHPLSRAYRVWWYVTIVAACFTGWLEPFRVAYLPDQCWTDSTTLALHPATLLSTLTMIIFCIDIVVSFFVGYFDETGALVVDSRRVALKYARKTAAAGEMAGAGAHRVTLERAQLVGP